MQGETCIEELKVTEKIKPEYRKKCRKELKITEKIIPEYRKVIKLRSMRSLLKCKKKDMRFFFIVKHLLPN